MKRVGILGAGQLGCMLSESLFRFGAETLFYDPDSQAPGFARCPKSFCGSWYDFEKLKSFFDECDVVTYEFENVSVLLLDKLVEETNVPLFPSSNVLRRTQNRIQEKNFLKDNLFPVCSFDFAYCKEELIEKLKNWTFPFVLKTATGGYDGRGQWKIEDKKGLNVFLNQFSEDNFPPFVVEELVNFEKEASCLVARNTHGNSVCFPIFENEHRDGILYRTTVPAQIPLCVVNELKEIALRAAEKLNVHGLLTTEFFLSKLENRYKIYVNEFAPRPHNSGHVTRNACQFSQFDAHARVLLGLPLHEPTLNEGVHCMGNLMGKTFVSLKSWSDFPSVVDVVLYGKKEARPKRKMGHFVVKSNTVENAHNLVEMFGRALHESV